LGTTGLETVQTCFSLARSFQLQMIKEQMQVYLIAVDFDRISKVLHTFKAVSDNNRLIPSLS
jgi:hypothetical protein